MANKVKVEDKKLPTLTKMPPLNFGGRPSMFSGGKGLYSRNPAAGFVPPKIRITQSKGAGGK